MVLSFPPFFPFYFSISSPQTPSPPRPPNVTSRFSGTLPLSLLSSLRTPLQCFLQVNGLFLLAKIYWAVQNLLFLKCHCPYFPPFVLHCCLFPLCDSFLWRNWSFTASSHVLVLCTLQQLYHFSAWLENKVHNLSDDENSKRATRIKKQANFLWTDLLFLPLEKSSLNQFCQPSLQLHTCYEQAQV